jgi:dipeptidyl aminopeptidase/acylaminoacyl peptidase
MLAAVVVVAWAAAGATQAAPFTIEQALAYPFVDGLTAAAHADRIAWVRMVRGARNVWVADGPDLTPRQVTQFKADDGQEITSLTFSPDGRTLVFVRGGDHDANWPAKDNLAPDPASSPEEPKVTLWLADPAGAKPAAAITEGDDPAITDAGVLAYVKTGQVWTAKLDGTGAKRLLFDRGKDGGLTWSPDGKRLAFVSNREDHAFIGVYAGPDQPICWMAASTGRDSAPVWSPDGARIAFTRRPGVGGAPEPRLTETPHPWSIWTVDAASGVGRKVWSSPTTLRGSYPEVAGEANLHWATSDRLVFLSTQDDWPHLYAVDDKGVNDKGWAEARLLTPGAFMVEHMAMAPDLGAVIYSANTGPSPADDDRRHLFAVKISGGAPFALTSGETLEWSPAVLKTAIAFIGADARNPPTVQVVLHGSGVRKILDNQAPPAEFAGAQFVVPKKVTFTAPDGLVIHGQLFQAAQSTQTGASKTPGLIFVHGGPPRQMMLGWSYMDYYTHAYAMNQYYAAHGYTVLSVNYRLGIGYGYDFQHPAGGGPRGSSEYQDVLAGGHFLQGVAGVDPARVGIWGGSYGGLLTALALGRNSDVFKAGVDFHGVHDWSRVLAEAEGPPLMRFEQGDRTAMTEQAFRASPDADLATWTSPVLLIQGDDDRNVRFNETIDLANRLAAKGVSFEELVIPNEIHGFLRWGSWLKADEASSDFLRRKLGAP